MVVIILVLRNVKISNIKEHITTVNCYLVLHFNY